MPRKKRAPQSDAPPVDASVAEGLHHARPHPGGRRRGRVPLAVRQQQKQDEKQELTPEEKEEVVDFKQVPLTDGLDAEDDGDESEAPTASGAVGAR